MAPVFLTAILAYGARDGSVGLGEWGGVLETGEYLTPTRKELLRARDGSREPAEDLSAAASRIATVVSLGVSKAERSRAVATLELAASAWASVSMIMMQCAQRMANFVRAPPARADEAGLPRDVHVWNSSHLVARYVLIHLGEEWRPSRRSSQKEPTNVRGTVRVGGERVQSSQGQAWCQAAMRAWVGPQARARRGRLMLHSRSSRKSWTTTQRHDVHSHARNLRRHFATRRRLVSPPHRSDRRISALKFSAQGRPMQPRAELRS